MNYFIGTTTLENHLALSGKTEDRHALRLSDFAPGGMCSQQTLVHVHQGESARIFIEASFIMAGT